MSAEVPEVEVRRITVKAVMVAGPMPELFEGAEAYGYEVHCPHEHCGYVDLGTYMEEAEEIKYQHQKWHEDGMPE